MIKFVGWSLDVQNPAAVGEAVAAHRIGGSAAGDDRTEAERCAQIARWPQVVDARHRGAVLDVILPRLVERDVQGQPKIVRALDLCEVDRAAALVFGNLVRRHPVVGRAPWMLSPMQSSQQIGLTSSPVLGAMRSFRNGRGICGMKASGLWFATVT